MYKKAAPFLLVFMTLTGLVLMHWLPPYFNVFNQPIRNPNLVSDMVGLLAPPPTPDTLSTVALHKDTLKVQHLKIDTLLALTYQINLDSVLEREKADLRFSCFSDSSVFFPRFLSSLKAVRDSSGKTRIAYFGDSMIEGDLISQSLRNDLQNELGGKGVGFVPITSVVSQFRRSIRHTFSNDWKEYSIQKSREKKNFAPSGFVFNPKMLTKDQMLDTAGSHNPSYVCYTAPDDSYERLSKLYLTKLYYGKPPQNAYIKYYIDGKANSLILNGTTDVNELVLNTVKPYKELRIEFFTDSILDVYGVSFEMPKGIYIDNFAVRGNLGMALQKIPENVLRDFNKHMDYSLLIFQFGLNVASPEARGFRWYENAMVDVISYYKNIIPNADILIVSIGDKSHKYDMEYVTQPGIPRLVEAQRNIASRTKSHFWNLYANMGGYNSMKSWVEAKRPLASKDYAHINFAGAEKISKMLSENIFNEFKLFEYEQYKEGEKDILIKNILNSEKKLTDTYISFEKQYKLIGRKEALARLEPDTAVRDSKQPLAEKDTFENEKTDTINEVAKGDICEFRVQVAASKAELEISEYKSLLAYADNKILRKIKHRDGYNRVYITPYNSPDSAQRLADTLATLGSDAFVVGFINDDRAPVEKVVKRMHEKPIVIKEKLKDSLIKIHHNTTAGLSHSKNEKQPASGFYTFDKMPEKNMPVAKPVESYLFITGRAHPKKYTEQKPDELPVFRVQFCASDVPLEKSFYQNVADYFGDSVIIISKEEDGMIRYMLGEYKDYGEAVRALNKVFELKQDGFVTAYYHNKRIKPEKAIDIIKKSKK